jgi:hypothetical protein
MTEQTASGTATEYATSHAPTTAPASMNAMAAPRLGNPGLLPPAREESAARPVIVKVNTVVVRSGTTSLRTVAFRIPMARAVRTMTP